MPADGTKRRRVLLVEDNPDDAFLFREYLVEAEVKRAIPTRFEIVVTETLAQTLSLETGRDYDIILLDLTLPDGRGLELLDRVHGAYPGIPIIILTGLDDERTAVEALERNAQDYLVKGKVTPELLWRAIHYAIERNRLDAQKKHFMILASHELKTPATLISGYAELMTMETDLPLECRKHLTYMRRGVQWLTAVVNDLIEGVQLDLRRMPLHKAPILLEDLLVETLDRLSPFLQSRQLELCVDGSIATQPPIEGDRRRLWQVFTNLLGNAIKFTPDGGEIRISATPWNGECRVSIADNGIGIPAEKLEAVFEPFVTLENPMLHSSSKSAFMGGGIGLGLTIAQGIVEAHGGKIWAESNEAGALFHLTLPYHPHGR